MTDLHYPIAITGHVRVHAGTEAQPNAQRILEMLTALLRHHGVAVTAAVLGEARSELPKAGER